MVAAKASSIVPPRGGTGPVLSAVVEEEQAYLSSLMAFRHSLPHQPQPLGEQGLHLAWEHSKSDGRFAGETGELAPLRSAGVPGARER